MTGIMIPKEDQWERLIRLTEMFLTQGAEDTELSEKYIALLEYLKDDRIIDHQNHELGLLRAPASQSRHHAFEGGLVHHLLQMFDIWTTLSHGIRERLYQGPMGDLPDYLGHSYIWRAILHHDLNKVWKYKLVSSQPWKVEYATDPLSSLLTDTHKSLHLLGRQDIHLPVVLHNALIVAEGGFSDANPRAESVLAKIAYILDELSANVVDRLLTGKFWDSKEGGISEVP